MTETAPEVFSDKTRSSAVKRLGEAALFIGLATLTGLALMAVVLATPLVLLGAAIAGALSQGPARRRWRSLAA